MRITCPHCGFTKEIAADKIPAKVVRVNCPDCHQPFPLTREETLESAATIEDILTKPVAPDATRPAVSTPLPPTAATEAQSESAGGTTTTETLNRGSGDSITIPEHLAIPESADVDSAELATISARYAALLVDSILIMSMVLILRFGLALLSNDIRLEGHILLNLTFMLFTLTLGFTYHALFIGVCGQTPGKMLLRIKVVMIDQTTMTYPKAILREVLGKTLSAPFLLGYVMALFHPQRATAHDKIADTRVVKFTHESPSG